MGRKDFCVTDILISSTLLVYHHHHVLSIVYKYFSIKYKDFSRQNHQCRKKVLDVTWTIFFSQIYKKEK